MSYILDALRKAERDRHVSRVPTLATAHGSADLLRRPHWVWAAVAGALALGGAITFTLVRTPPTRPDPVRTVVAPAPPAPALPVAPSTVSPPPADPLPPAPLERALGPRPAPAPGVAPGPAVEHPSAGPRVTPAAPSTKVAPTGSPGPAPVTPGVPAQPAAAAPVAAAAPPAPRAVVEPVPRIAQTPTNSDPVAPSTADPVPASPPPEGGVRAPAAAPAPTSPPSRLTLDVLVYSDDPVGRLVFINGKKYLEGQTVEGDTIVEQITQEGAVLRQGGQRIVLRPKLNPYSRPTSP